MRKHAVIIGLTFLGLAAFAVFAGWAFFAGSKLGGGWHSLGPIWPYVLGGALIVGALTGVLMWLRKRRNKAALRGGASALPSQRIMSVENA